MGSSFRRLQPLCEGVAASLERLNHPFLAHLTLRSQTPRGEPWSRPRAPFSRCGGRSSRYLSAPPADRPTRRHGALRERRPACQFRPAHQHRVPSCPTAWRMKAPYHESAARRDFADRAASSPTVTDIVGPPTDSRRTLACRGPASPHAGIAVADSPFVNYIRLRKHIWIVP